jgi:hypothetical protein
MRDVLVIAIAALLMALAAAREHSARHRPALHVHARQKCTEEQWLYSADTIIQAAMLKDWIWIMLLPRALLPMPIPTCTPMCQGSYAE